jgi:hypothetical protein
LKLARALLCGCLLWTSVYAAEYESGEHPLLDLARALEATRKPQPNRRYYAPELRASEHALEQAQPPADADCARSIGASVYADLYLDLAGALEARGEFPGAVQAPRAGLHATQLARPRQSRRRAVFRARHRRCTRRRP